MVIPGKRIPTRGKRTGSVRIVIPKKLISTVECPSHASVTCVSVHFEGSGFAKAGAIGRQLSIVHSRNRCPSQRRTLDPRGIGCCGACTTERNTAIIAVASSNHLGLRRQQAGSLHDRSDRMTKLRPARPAKQSFDRLPERSSWFGWPGAGDEDGHIRSVQNVPR